MMLANTNHIEVMETDGLAHKLNIVYKNQDKGTFFWFAKHTPSGRFRINTKQHAHVGMQIQSL